MYFYNPAPWETRAHVEKEKQRKQKELSSSKSKLMHLEIPMEDIERTSTPLPMEEKLHWQEYQSDV